MAPLGDRRRAVAPRAAPRRDRASHRDLARSPRPRTRLSPRRPRGRLRARSAPRHRRAARGVSLDRARAARDAAHDAPRGCARRGAHRPLDTRRRGELRRARAHNRGSRAPRRAGLPRGSPVGLGAAVQRVPLGPRGLAGCGRCDALERPLRDARLGLVAHARVLARGPRRRDLCGALRPRSDAPRPLEARASHRLDAAPRRRRARAPRGVPRSPVGVVCDRRDAGLALARVEARPRRRLARRALGRAAPRARARRSARRSRPSASSR